VCVVISAELSRSPRMLKAADALAAAGHDVRVVSARFGGWPREADRGLARTWRTTEVNCARDEAPLTYLRSGVRVRAARALAQLIGPERSPLALAADAYGRVRGELLQAVLAEPADLVYSGTGPAMPVAHAAGLRLGVPYAIDVEDLHHGEQPATSEGRLFNGLAARIEAAVLRGAAFVTAGSTAMAEAYAHRYGIAPIAVHNVFPLPASAPQLSAPPRDGLRLYWFGQTVGRGRGLEDVVRAMAGLRGELHLRGRPAGSFLDTLRRQACREAPELQIFQHDPAPPGQMVALCEGYDVGIALETADVANRVVSLSNKALTYPLAGLPAAITDTPGQRELARDLSEGAIVAAPGDVAALAAGLRRWAGDRALLARARAAAWEAARRRWHWEHPDERGALLGAVERVLG
jgi:glycosyltransferase involved in cell wall biosynthesis